MSSRNDNLKSQRKGDFKKKAKNKILFKNLLLCLKEMLSVPLNM